MMKTCCTDPTYWDKGRKKKKKTESVLAVCPYGRLDFYNYQTNLDAGFLEDRVIHEEVLYVYNIHIVEKRFSISIAHVRSRGGLLVTE
jgi:hypothetical protein